MLIIWEYIKASLYVNDVCACMRAIHALCSVVHIHIHLILSFHHGLLNRRLGPYTPPKQSEQTSLCMCACCRVSREFGRWKVNSLAVEKRNSVGGSGGLALPLDPDFMHTIRQLGRRPTLQTITECLIKKYGTHLLLSATLGGTVEYAELQSKPDSHSF